MLLAGKVNIKNRKTLDIGERLIIRKYPRFILFVKYVLINIQSLNNHWCGRKKPRRTVQLLSLGDE